MLRSIAAVIISYVVMAILIMVTFAGLWFGLGPDGLLQPGSYKGNMIINIAAPGITILAGLLGGWLCTRIARNRAATVALAGIVLVLGLTMAAFTLQKPYPADPRPAGMTVQEIMKVGREPTWVAISNPIIGAIAVIVGGLLTATRRPRRV